MKTFVIKHKKIIIIIIILSIIIALLLFFTFAFSFGYMTVETDASGKTDVSIGGNEYISNIEFLRSNKKSMSFNSYDTKDADGNVSVLVKPIVKLTRSEIEIQNDVNYNVYLNIISNTHVYSENDSVPEILLQITDPSGNVYKHDYDSLKYVTHEGISGYDVTTFSGELHISNYFIKLLESEDEKTEEWQFNFILINNINNKSINKDASLEVEISMNETFVEIPFSTRLLEVNGGSADIASKPTPNFTEIANTNEGMFATPDDYGTSYYFRGAVDNNWVNFGGYYWRIIRINGDGSIRMIYSGETAPLESQRVVMTGAGTSIGTSAFISNDTSAEYSGYMYTLGEANGNAESSVMKTYIDAWYETNLSTYETYLSDTLFCSDRTVSGSTIGTQTFPIVEPIGSVNVNFSGPSRFVGSGSWISGGTGPILLCSNKSDRYTVDENVTGNGTLTYPVALINSDEAILAGLPYSKTNNQNYLFSANSYYTITPWQMYADHSFITHAIIASNGMVESAYYINNVENSLSAGGVRPVINLKSDLNIEGMGHWNNPYVVVGDF